MAEITYEDKTEDSGVPIDSPARKFSAADANEIKAVVNAKQDAIVPISGWSEPEGFTPVTFTIEEYSGGGKTVADMAEMFAALISNLKEKGILE